MTDPDLPPSLDDIAALAATALDRLPAHFADPIRHVPIIVEDFPGSDVMHWMDLGSPFDIMGLYHGVDLASKLGGASPADLDRIFLYRRPILDYWCETAESLSHVVAHVLIHEIGHHFGLSDDDMAVIEGRA
tara:strand:- start:26 stop:421 length:396 start_codon:yes stop_codon:yes gene_type:complete